MCWKILMALVCVKPSTAKSHFLFSARHCSVLRKCRKYFSAFCRVYRFKVPTLRCVSHPMHQWFFKRVPRSMNKELEGFRPPAPCVCSTLYHSFPLSNAVCSVCLEPVCLFSAALKRAFSEWHRQPSRTQEHGGGNRHSVNAFKRVVFRYRWASAVSFMSPYSKGLRIKEHVSEGWIVN